MASFSLVINRERQLTRVQVHGRVTADELIGAIRSYYDGEPTDHVLWDVRDADLTLLHAADVKSIEMETLQYADKRGTGRTAIVARDDLGFGLGRMFDTYQELDASPRSHRTFKTIEEAYKWLFQDR